MKKMIAVLALLCAVVLPFSAMAETPVIVWDEVGAPVVEAAEIAGDFCSLPELGLAIFVPEGLYSVEVPEEDAAAGRLYLLTDEDQSRALIVDAVHVDGMTLDQALDNAVANGMFEPEIVNIHGLSALTYKNEAINAGCIVLVDTNSNMIIFSFGPFSEEGADMIFYLICSSIMPLE
jgi:hypothetical protein